MSEFLGPGDLGRSYYFGISSESGLTEAGLNSFKDQIARFCSTYELLRWVDLELPQKYRYQLSGDATVFLRGVWVPLSPCLRIREYDLLEDLVAVKRVIVKPNSLINESDFVRICCNQESFRGRFFGGETIEPNSPCTLVSLRKMRAPTRTRNDGDRFSTLTEEPDILVEGANV